MRPAYVATVICLVALAIRLALSFTVPIQIGVDGSEYLALAQNIRWHDAFSYGAIPHKWGDRGVLDAAGPYLPTAARAPLYPAMIAILWWQEQPPFYALRIAQCLLAAMTAVFVYFTALRLFGARAALLAGLAMALGPFSIFITPSFISEALFSFLLAGGMWAWGRGNPILAGLLLGAATLTRAILLPIMLFTGLMALILKFNRLTHAKIALAALLMVGPWTVRNAMVLHQFIPVSTMGWGANILLGTRPVKYGSGNAFFTYVKDETFVDAIRNSANEAEAEAKMFRAGLERIRQAPFHWLFVRITQYPRFFVETPGYLFPYVPAPTILVTAVYFAATAVFLGLSAAGLLIALPRWREMYPIALFTIAIAGAFFVGANEERYSLAMLPMTAVLAASALARTWNRLRPVQSRSFLLL